ncbi:hypothetical protein H0H93_010157 [Arthromyces matolae]|nr:hypothetical protein H0H93_010157 [Arthromyces matolae]
MSTRARTRAAAAVASTSKVESPASPPPRTQQKSKTQTRKASLVANSLSHQPDEKENLKSKDTKTIVQASRKTSTVPKKSTRSTPVVHCTCKKGDDGTPMVQCGACKIWYHFRCVDLKEEDAEDINIYICPSCASTTKLRTTMTWEGDEAIEKSSHSELAVTPTQEKKPTVKREKKNIPTDVPSSESEGDASSEDDYVDEEERKGKGVAKRTRPLPSSSESESDVSEDAKPRRHRIRKASESSPPPNASKRKGQQHADHTPPPKRKKSDLPQSTEDPIRKYCLSKLEELFKDVFLRYPRVHVEGENGVVNLVEKSAEELSEEETAGVLTLSKQFADELEKCVFDIYSEHDKSGHLHAGANYKERFRMLQFNLSKVDRVVIHQRIVSAEITPKEISLMSSTDLANEETKKSIKNAEQEALAYSILKPTTAPRAKITHKGLEDIESVNEELVTGRDEERSRQADERRERERLARLKAQPRQRTESVSVPPESPITPSVAHPQQPWGGPPAVPLQSLLRSDIVPPSPTALLNESNVIVPTFNQPFTEAAEPELNLAEFINIDDEVPTLAAATSTTSPIAIDTSTDDVKPLHLSPKESPAAPSTMKTGISPFAPQSDTSATSTFNLDALWNAPKVESPKSPSTKTEEPVASTSSPRAIADDKETSMDVDSGATDDYDFDMLLEERDSAANSADAQQAAFDALPQVWDGKISMPLDSTVPQEVSVNARQVGGRPLEHGSLLWKTLFPSDLLRIDGRVPIENSGKYLLQMRMNSTKELVAVAFSPSTDGADVPFRILSDFLIAKGRHGLIFPWGMKPKDHHPGRELYIIPLLSSDVLPEYIELLDNLRIPKLRKANLFIGIWVLNKGKLALPPTLPPPVIPSFPPIQPQAQASSIPGSTMRPSISQASQGAPHGPPDIAAEVASLTPEQIQLMIQTLTGNGTLPLPNLQTGHHAPPPPPPASLPHHPQTYHPHATQPWQNHQGFVYPPGPPGPPSQRPPPMSWDRPGGSQLGLPDSHNRDGRGWRGGRGADSSSRGRGRGSEIPQRPVDSGWPRRAPH